MVRSESAPVQRQEQSSLPNLQRQTPCGCGCEGGTLRTRQGKTFEVCLSKGLGLRELLIQAPLAPSQKNLIRVIFDHERGKGSCYVSIQRLMLATGLRSRQSVFTHVGELKRLGVVSAQAPGGGNPHRCNLYGLHWGALLPLVLSPQPPRSRRQPPRSVPERSAVVPAAVKTAVENESPCGEECCNDLPEEAPASGNRWQNPPEEPGEMALEWPGEEAVEPSREEHADALVVGEPEREPEAPSEMLPPVVLVEEQDEELTPQRNVSPLESSTVSAPEASPPASFQVSFAILWKFWRAAYLEAYGRAYLDSPEDRRVVPMLATACSAAVSHRLLAEPSASPSLLTEQFLRHVFRAYLRRPGRNDFLRERAHPLALLLPDLNALGTPWGKAPSPTRPLEIAPPPTFLAPQENVRHIRDLLEGLRKKPEIGATPTPRPGPGRRKE